MAGYALYVAVTMRTNCASLYSASAVEQPNAPETQLENRVQPVVTRILIFDQFSPGNHENFLVFCNQHVELAATA